MDGVREVRGEPFGKSDRYGMFELLRNGEIVGQVHEYLSDAWVAVPSFATSLDAIKRLEDEAGYKVAIWVGRDEIEAHAFKDVKKVGWGNDAREAPARCKAYLVFKGRAEYYRDSNRVLHWRMKDCK